MALSTNQALYLKLDGNSNDSVGSNNGTDTSITYSSGNGKIIQGAGGSTGSKIALGNPAALQISGAQTVSFWFKAGSQSGATRIVFFSGGISGVSDGAIGIIHYASGYLSFQISNGSSLHAIEPSSGATASDFLDGNWHMITLVFIPSTSWTLYRDGVQYSQITSSVISSRTTSKNWSIYKIDTDQSANARDGFDGNIDEFGVWSRALSGAEITELYNGGAGIQYPYATDVSVSAGVQSATFSQPAATVTAIRNATISAGVQSATFSAPARTVTGTANVTASTPSATFSIPAVNIITPDAQVNVGVLSATFSIPAMTVRISNTVSQGTPPSATFSIPSSSVKIDFTHASSVFGATFTVPAPTISAESNITISPSALSATFSLPAVTVSGEQNAMIEAGVLSATFSVQAPTVTAIRNITVDASVLSALFSVQTPRKVGGLWTAQPRNEGVWTAQGRVI